MRGKLTREIGKKAAAIIKKLPQHKQTASAYRRIKRALKRRRNAQDGIIPPYVPTAADHKRAVRERRRARLEREMQEKAVDG